MKVQIAGEAYDVEFRDDVRDDGLPIDSILDVPNHQLIVPNYLTAARLAKVVDSHEAKLTARDNIGKPERLVPIPFAGQVA